MPTRQELIDEIAKFDKSIRCKSFTKEKLTDILNRLINENGAGSARPISEMPENEKECMGMTQLYTTFDSLELSKKIILYDLYVRSEYRNKGIGRMLMNAAKGFAEEKGVTSDELSTAITNKNAQSLYESLNYQRDTEYYDYYLPIK